MLKSTGQNGALLETEQSPRPPFDAYPPASIETTAKQCLPKWSRKLIRFKWRNLAVGSGKGRDLGTVLCQRIHSLMKSPPAPARGTGIFELHINYYYRRYLDSTLVLTRQPYT